MKKYFDSIIFILFCLIILLFSLRGLSGNPSSKEVDTPKWKDAGPFELSPERGRFALLYALIENKTVNFDTDLARFVSPDLGYKDGKYVSLFAPGVSFLLIPAFLIGKELGLSQVGTFFGVAVFATINAYLIKKISATFNVSKYAANLAAITFLFATPAYAYAVNLYQHHISLFCILLAFYLLLRFNSFLSLAGVWCILALSVVIDYPNFFMAIPLGIWGLLKLINIKNDKKVISLKINQRYILTFFSAILPLIFFFWFNNVSYGNPLQLSGTVARVVGISENGSPIFENSTELDTAIDGDHSQAEESNQKSAVGFFKTRNLLNGFFIHFLSPDRGVLHFAPILLFVPLGIYFLYRKNKFVLSIILGIMGLNILFYSMWGDPWGGWAFGSRYLIPSYALSAILLSLVYNKGGKKLLLLIAMISVLIYSIWVNTIGAITTSQNPPRIQVLELEKITNREEKYTWKRNWDMILSNNSKSFIYKTCLQTYFSAKEYFYLIVSLIGGASIMNIILLLVFERRKEK